MSSLFTLRWSSERQLSLSQPTSSTPEAPSRPPPADVRDGNERIAVCPMASMAFDNALRALCQCDSKPMLNLLHDTVSDAREPVLRFLEGTIVYVLSKEWADLLAVYIFRLHAQPYCLPQDIDGTWLSCTDSGVSAFMARACGTGRQTPRVCSAEAAAWVQAGYAIVLLFVAQRARIMASSVYRHGADTATSMTGMCVGWSAGAAAVQWFRELDDEPRRPHSHASNLSLAMAMTLACATALACGAGAPTDEWVLAGKALRTLVCVVWTFALTELLKSGLTQGQLGGARIEVWERLQLLWAISLTAVLSIGEGYLVRCRRWIELHEAAARRAAESEVAPSSRRSSCASRACGAARAWTSSLLELLEGAFSWTTGCAWTDALLSNIGSLTSYPTPSVTTSDAAVAMALLGVALGWLLLGGEPRPGGLQDEDKLDRSKVERHFLTNAASFFVGWVWVVLLRDISLLFSDVVEDALVSVSSLNSGGFWGRHFTDLMLAISEHASRLTEVLLVIVFGPLLTWLLFKAKEWVARDERWQRRSESGLGVELCDLRGARTLL